MLFNVKEIIKEVMFGFEFDNCLICCIFNYAL